MRKSRAGSNAGVLAEDLRIGMEADPGAAPVVDLAELLQRALRHAARKALAIELAAARDLDLELVGQRVDDRDADAVQAAGGLVDLASRTCRRQCSMVMMTSSADLSGNFGCGSTGMPRPLSVTVRKPSASSSTSMKLAWPATASSIELSMTSANRWCSAFSSVPPIYMPGRLRTGSRPFQNLDVGRAIAFAAVLGRLRRALGGGLHQRVGRARGGKRRAACRDWRRDRCCRP